VGDNTAFVYSKASDAKEVAMIGWWFLIGMLGGLLIIYFGQKKSESFEEEFIVNHPSTQALLLVFCSLMGFLMIPTVIAGLFFMAIGKNPNEGDD
jgi:hypothetical protein